MAEGTGGGRPFNKDTCMLLRLLFSTMVVMQQFLKYQSKSVISMASMKKGEWHVISI